MTFLHLHHHVQECTKKQLFFFGSQNWNPKGKFGTPVRRLPPARLGLLSPEENVCFSTLTCTSQTPKAKKEKSTGTVETNWKKLSSFKIRIKEKFANATGVRTRQSLSYVTLTPFFQELFHQYVTLTLFVPKLFHQYVFHFASPLIVITLEMQSDEASKYAIRCPARSWPDPHYQSKAFHAKVSVQNENSYNVVIAKITMYSLSQITVHSLSTTSDNYVFIL